MEDNEEIKESIQQLKYKYFSKFWHESPSVIRSEFKFQDLSSSDVLLQEITENSKIIKIAAGTTTLNELMIFTTYFNQDLSKRYQKGFTLRT